MEELIVNLHMHTTYSDGRGSHQDIADAALRAGLDVVITTDHNVWVNGPEGYYKDGDRRVLLLVGEEIHDQAREPQKNHTLVLGANREMCSLAPDPQRLMDAIRQAGGLAILAHVVDPPSRTFGETDISWEDWNVQGYTGIELWNSMSEFKGHLKSWLHAIFYAFNFGQVACGPFPEAVQKWDALLAEGKRVVAVGGSDAHELRASMGPLHRVLFPYENHFRAINTHLLTPTALSGDLFDDRRMVLDAFRQGHAFIGYDLPHPTRGFRFVAKGHDEIGQMGDEVSGRSGVTFQIKLPVPAECRLVKDGKTIKSWNQRENITYITSEPGVYRVEVFVNYLGKKRSWIISNPIYVR